MARIRSQHVCQSCGHVAMAWTGQCPDCREWNTLVEQAAPRPAAKAPGGKSGNGRALAAGAAGQVLPLKDVRASRVERFPTGIGEFDRVLGGGLVPGSL
ncbi:MAG TPA: DNA repair protein RadA, partial [Solirubrobacterales bacterium]|nr:DNA repair protein RadA [Solirubrobacterales bacterium]